MDNPARYFVGISDDRQFAGSLGFHSAQSQAGELNTVIIFHGVISFFAPHKPQQD
jgi:hypothetical protein